MCMNSLTNIGLFQKISTLPLWTTLNWVLTNFRISKNDNSSFCRIPNVADSKYWGIPVKIHKILEKFMDFQSTSLSIFYRISNVVNGRGGLDIFWNSPLLSKGFQSILKGYRYANTRQLLSSFISLQATTIKRANDAEKL